jgi:peptide/nickel transport system substrate-binding protein
VPSSQRAWAIQAPNAGPGYWKDAPRWSRDTAKAKQLLSAAGVSGLELEMVDYLPVEGQSEIVQANLAEVGITLKILKLSAIPDNFTTDPAVGQLTGVTYDGVPDPYVQFEWWTTNQIGTWNWAFFKNKQYDANARAIGVTQDDAARAKLAISNQKLMAASDAFIWLYYAPQLHVSSRRVTGVFNLTGQPYPTLIRPV